MLGFLQCPAWSWNPVTRNTQVIESHAITLFNYRSHDWLTIKRVIISINLLHINHKYSPTCPAALKTIFKVWCGRYETNDMKPAATSSIMSEFHELKQHYSVEKVLETTSNQWAQTTKSWLIILKSSKYRTTHQHSEYCPQKNGICIQRCVVEQSGCCSDTHSSRVWNEQTFQWDMIPFKQYISKELHKISGMLFCNSTVYSACYLDF